MTAIAIGNNDVAFIAWSYPAKIPDCLGFSIRRKDLATGQTRVLPAWVGFEGDTNPNWQPSTTDQWPIQKFNWRDFNAKPGGKYQYQVVPMIGQPGSLAPDVSKATTTNIVELTSRRGKFLSYFNQGILSTQSVAHFLPTDAKGIPSSKDLLTHIGTPGDPLRLRLAGEIIEALEHLLNRAQSEGGKCYMALYELSDPELVSRLTGNPSVHLLLSNTGPDDKTDKSARKTLHNSTTDITDRMLKSGHIGHNKFVVYVDKGGTPRAVLTGSTNWTSTAICAQSNNALLCEDAAVAKKYFDYWNRLQADTVADHGTNQQSATFRADNNAAIDFPSIKGTLWFSPNTKQQKKPAGKNPPKPKDMGDVFKAIAAAKQAIVFLVFQPGSPSVVDAIADAVTAKPSLFVRGASTDPRAANDFNTRMYSGSMAKPSVYKYNPRMAPATAINDKFAYWQKELLKSSSGAHAIIHDKSIVIDPLSDDCVVITGSHNLGYTASYANDENLLVIRGNKELAAAYTTHVMDIYDHYRWRYWIQEEGKAAWQGLKRTPAWQAQYFAGGVPVDDMLFWAPIS